MCRIFPDLKTITEIKKGMFLCSEMFFLVVSVVKKKGKEKQREGNSPLQISQKETENLPEVVNWMIWINKGMKL